MTGPGLMTIDDLEPIPDDAHRYELLRGGLLRTPPGTWRHAVTLATVTSCLVGFVDEHEHEHEGELGWVCVGAGFILGRDPDTLLAVDVSFIRAERVLSETEWDRRPEFAPELAIEIVSPSDTGPDIADKVAEFLGAGVALVWVFNPRHRTVAVHRNGRPVRVLTEADELDGEDILPGLRLRLAGLF